MFWNHAKWNSGRKLTCQAGPKCLTSKIKVVMGRHGPLLPSLKFLELPKTRIIKCRKGICRYQNYTKWRAYNLKMGDFKKKTKVCWNLLSYEVLKFNIDRVAEGKPCLACISGVLINHKGRIISIFSNILGS